MSDPRVIVTKFSADEHGCHFARVSDGNGHTLDVSDDCGSWLTLPDHETGIRRELRRPVLDALQGHLPASARRVKR